MYPCRSRRPAGGGWRLRHLDGELARPRLRTQLRRHRRVDPERGELACDGEAVRLTEAEIGLLRQLARNPHEPVERLELAPAA